MKLATLDDGSRDGRLVVVDRAGQRQLPAHDIAPTLQRALDDWERCAPRLRALGASLESGASGQPLAGEQLLAPLPRAYEWVDGSAYLNHIRLVRRARGAEPPATLETEPLVYQGGSGALLGPNAPFPLPDPEWGLDFEAEVCVVLGDVRRGLLAGSAEPAILLLMLANDWSYRNFDSRGNSQGVWLLQLQTCHCVLAVCRDAGRAGPELERWAAVWTAPLQAQRPTHR